MGSWARVTKRALRPSHGGCTRTQGSRGWPNVMLANKKMSCLPDRGRHQSPVRTDADSLPACLYKTAPTLPAALVDRLAATRPVSGFSRSKFAGVTVTETALLRCVTVDSNRFA